jgi:hypothetical protein
MAVSFYNLWYDFKGKIASFLRAYWRYLPNRWYLFFIFIMHIILFLFAYQIFKNIGNDLFVSHYNVDFGIDGIGSAYLVFNVPILSSIISLANIVLIIIVSRSRSFHFLAQAANLSSILISFLAGLALMSLYLINFIA